MIIVGFGHKKRRGKDQCVKFALAFARQYFPSLRCEIMSFGDQLKDVAYTMFKWGGLEESVYYENNPSQIETILPAIGLSPRQIWDQIGLMGRNIHPKVWTQMAATNSPEADVFFSKDVRFPTEIELIELFKGYHYRVDRDVPEGGDVDKALDFFKSWHGIIDNNGTLRDLNLKIKPLVCAILNKQVLLEKIVCPSCFATKRASLLAADIAKTTTRFMKCGACSLEFHA